MSNDYEPYDVEQQDATKAAKAEAAEQTLRDEVGDLQWLMGNKRGRRIMWRQIAKTGIYLESFNLSGSVTAFNEGRRSVGLRQLALITEHCPDQYILMLQEARK